MLEETFKKIIMELLGNVVENFESNEIKIDKWNGFIEKKNLIVKKEFINKLGV
jgi:hypothetical protein